MSTTSAAELLFSYGTLQLEAVQLSTFGRRLVGVADVLPGFAQSWIEIDDAEVVATSGEKHHPIVAYTGKAADSVAGTVFEITHEELLNADAYEVDDYTRIAVTLGSGLTAWVYVEKTRHQEM
jgi:hypothetical protein